MIDDASFSRAVSLRADLIAQPGDRAFRLYDGPREGEPGSPTIEVFGKTAVTFVRSSEVTSDEKALLVAKLQQSLPGLRAVVWKQKGAFDTGTVVFGSEQDVTRRVEEASIKYCVRLLAHHDATFFLDTALLRAYLRETGAGKSVLNLFAYTGSLGVAAAVGGARVVNVDKNRIFLDQAKTSYGMNGLHIERVHFKAEDFFLASRSLRKSGAAFDQVVVDPPPFAAGKSGVVDVVNNLPALLNKVRPLVKDGGELIVVNNALFVSGEEFLQKIAEVCADGYAKLERTIGVPADCRAPLARPLPSDPAPFEHPTKIAVLRLRKK